MGTRRRVRGSGRGHAVSYRSLWVRQGLHSPSSARASMRLTSSPDASPRLGSPTRPDRPGRLPSAANSPPLVRENCVTSTRTSRPGEGFPDATRPPRLRTGTPRKGRAPAQTPRRPRPARPKAPPVGPPLTRLARLTGEGRDQATHRGVPADVPLLRPPEAFYTGQGPSHSRPPLPPALHRGTRPRDRRVPHRVSLHRRRAGRAEEDGGEALRK